MPVEWTRSRRKLLFSTDPRGGTFARQRKEERERERAREDRKQSEGKGEKDIVTKKTSEVEMVRQVVKKDRKTVRMIARGLEGNCERESGTYWKER